MTEHRCYPSWVNAAVALACSVTICVGILLVYCFMTNSWSLLAPRPKHAPAIELCYEGVFGNGCWE